MTFKEVVVPTSVEQFNNVEQHINNKTLHDKVTTPEPIVE